MTRRSWLVAGVALALLAAVAVWWLARDAGAPPRYRTAVVEEGALQAVVAASGTVNPVRQVSVGSQVSGQIKELFADFNTEVREGQLIARIDPESIQHRVRQAQADLDATRAQTLQAQANAMAAQATVSRAKLDADNAGRDLARKQELLARQFISPAEFEAARNLAGTLAEQLKVAQAQREVAHAQTASAQAAVQQRQAVLAQARVDLERTEIRSPVSGVVIKRSVDVGQTVAASLQAPELFIIARNLSDMQVEVSIDEADIGRVRPGQPVSFTVDAFPGRVFEGRVATVRKAAQNVSNVVTYTVVVAFSTGGAAGQLLPGMTANVRIVTDVREHALKIPNAALRVRLPGVPEPAAREGEPPAVTSGSADVRRPAGSAGDGAATSSAGARESTGVRGRVYRLGEDGRPQAVSVRLGISDGRMTELLGGGLSAGQALVTAAPGTAGGNATSAAGPRLPF